MGERFVATFSHSRRRHAHTRGVGTHYHAVEELHGAAFLDNSVLHVLVIKMLSVSISM